MKSALDKIVSIIFIMVLFPLFFLIGLMLLILIDTPILFKQKRPGLNGSPFILYKFCSMTNEMNDDGIMLPDKERLTSIGKFLRKTSLDELPSIWNVLKGDMSMVGPRPLLMDYLPLYTKEQMRRHEVKPGITGWAQINGRNAISWEEKFELDIWYVENQSFWLDIKILGISLWKVIRQDGINQDSHASMEKFKGNN